MVERFDNMPERASSCLLKSSDEGDSRGAAETTSVERRRAKGRRRVAAANMVSEGD